LFPLRIGRWQPILRLLHSSSRGSKRRTSNEEEGRPRTILGRIRLIALHQLYTFSETTSSENAVPKTHLTYYLNILLPAHRGAQ
jgi:hypothetical protein